MPMLTIYKDPAGKFTVEEDSSGRLWLSVECAGAGGFNELHRRLTPGESRDFRLKPSKIDPRARFLLQNPAHHFDKAEEADYRRQ